MKKFSVLFLFFAVFSCSVLDKDSMEAVDEEKYKDVLGSLPEQICVFDPSQYFPAASHTKANSGSPVMFSSDDLDFDKAKSYSTEKADYLQIPILAEEVPLKTVVRFPEIEIGDSPMSPSGTAKMYLIVQDDKDSSAKRKMNVVMMVPQPKYMTQEQIDSADFFYDGHFNGVLFYSDLSGKMLKVETVINGELHLRGRIPENVSASDTIVATVRFLTKESTGEGVEALPASEDDPEMLDEALIVADRIDRGWKSDDPDHPSNNRDNDPQETEDEVDKYLMGGGNEKKIEVKISIVGRGYTTGQGFYKVGSIAYCTASSMNYAGTDISTFVGWSGFSTSTSSSISFTITTVVSEYKLRATFHDFRPCAEGDYRDPLLDMKILGTKGSGVDGGRFGMTRSGGTREHRGIDLDCPIGTPVFATISGRVSNTISNLNNNEDWTQYKSKGGKLNSVTFNCGNRIYITGKIAGQTVTVVYFHLQNIFVKDGMMVEAGDIIGQSGNSGSASDSACAGPHLHYQVQIWRNDSTVYLNPEDYIYSILDDDGMQTNPCN